MKRFIRELRRREVFRTAGLYIGICWILIEASSVMLPTFGAPEWILRWIIIGTFVGFPIMLVLAWIYDFTDHGIEVQAEATDTIVAPAFSRKMDFVVIGLLSVALLFSVYLNITAGPEIVEETDPVSVLIADIDNQTGNALFDGLLEQALSIGIEGAPHITSYQRDSALSIAEIVQPGAETLDSAVSRLVAVREGIDFVLSGAISPDGSGFEISLAALDPATGEEAFGLSSKANAPDAVLSAVSSLSEDVREEFGDTTLDQPNATASPFTAASLEAAKAFTEATQLEFDGKPDEAVARYEIATQLDPNFGRAYAGWALSEFRLGNNEKAESLWQKALSLMETMTERERLRTLGLYYAAVTRNYESAVESFSELVEKYPADAAGHNNLAVAAFLSLDFQLATEQGRQIMEIYPNSQLYRSNFALYAMYAGEFESAAAVASELVADSPEYGTPYLPIAVSHIAAGRFDEARAAYSEMAKAQSSDHRESTASLGLADLEAYLGRYQTAIEILNRGIESDIAAERLNAAAVKRIALAQVFLDSGNLDGARRNADEAREDSSSESVAVAAARLYVAIGDTDAARDIANELTSKLQPQSRAYGLMIRGMIARDSGELVPAIDAFRDAIELADLWLVRFELGRTYIEAEFYAEALGEFAACNDRRGEATAVFLDDTPSFRYLSELPYWTARAQQGLGMQSAASQAYGEFLALREEGGPLADDARQRLQ